MPSRPCLLPCVIANGRTPLFVEASGVCTISFCVTVHPCLAMLCLRTIARLVLEIPVHRQILHHTTLFSVFSNYLRDHTTPPSRKNTSHGEFYVLFGWRPAGRKTRVATRTKDSHFRLETIAIFFRWSHCRQRFKPKETVRPDVEALTRCPCWLFEVPGTSTGRPLMTLERAGSPWTCSPSFSSTALLPLRIPTSSWRTWAFSTGARARASAWTLC